MTRNNLNIGILGGGQLGRMLIQAARKMEEGFNCIVWEPNKEGCAFEVAHEKIIKPYDDKEALQEFINKVDKVVLEFENIPVEIVQQIEASGKLVAPSSKVLSVVQDRIAEKEFFRKNEIPCAKWHVVDSKESARDAVEIVGSPFILKTARFGYDGKGQAVCHSADKAIENWENFGEVVCIAEEMLFLTEEFSIIGARNEKGETVFYDVARNVHLGGILYTSTVPANLFGGMSFFEGHKKKAKEYVERAMEVLDVVGLLALEMFVVGDDILANEMAARPHNSGHWTMDGAETCQFEQCIRAATGMPFGSCERTQNIVMQNLLGSEIEYIRNDRDLVEIKICDYDRLHRHDYGKIEIREGRKMGHINYISERTEWL